jgi:hypothetical protein
MDDGGVTRVGLGSASIPLALVTVTGRALTVLGGMGKNAKLSSGKFCSGKSKIKAVTY